jgi:WD40 repeat protein
MGKAVPMLTPIVRRVLRLPFVAPVVPRALFALLAAACAATPVAGPEVRAPVTPNAAPVSAAPQAELAPGPIVHPVLQVIPPGGDVQWGGGGGALTVTGRACETSIVDPEAGRVTARIAACQVWPSPARDLFLVRHEDGSLAVWEGTGLGATALAGSSFSTVPAWSPDGRRLATVAGPVVEISAAERGQVVRRILLPVEAHGAPVHVEVSWRADGALLAAQDGKEMWTMATGGDALATPAGSTGPSVYEETAEADADVRAVSTGCVSIQHARFAPHGDGLLVSCSEDRAEVWDSRTERMVTSMPRTESWSATGRHRTMLAASAVEVRDAATGATELRTDGAMYDRYLFSADDAWLANFRQSSGSPSVDVWDVVGHKRVLRLPGMFDPRWSADGAYLSVRSANPRAPNLVVFAAGPWNEVWRRQESAQGAWSTAGAQLAVTSPEGGLELLDASTASTRPLPSATTAWFGRLYPAPDGALMAPMMPGMVDPFRGRARTAPSRASETGTGKAVRIEAGHDASVVDVPVESLDPWWSADGTRRAVSVSTSRGAMEMASTRLFVEDLSTKERTFVDGGFGPHAGGWSARGHRLLVAYPRPLLYEADTRRAWKIRADGAMAWALDAEGTVAALATPGGLQLVPLASKEPPILLSPKSDPPPVFLALSGSRLASVTRDGQVTVWNVETREVVATWSAGFAPEHVAWVGEGERLVLGRRDMLRVSSPDGSKAVTLTALRNGEETTLLSEAAR